MSGKIFIWIGGPREVFKPEARETYTKGVPFTAPGLFEDLFEKDPMFVEIDEKTHERVMKMWGKVEAMTEGTLKRFEARARTQAEVLKILEPMAKTEMAKTEMAKWKKARDEHRATTPQPVQPKARPNKETATTEDGDAE